MMGALCCCKRRRITLDTQRSTSNQTRNLYMSPSDLKFDTAHHTNREFVSTVVWLEGLYISTPLSDRDPQYAYPSGFDEVALHLKSGLFPECYYRYQTWICRPFRHATRDLWFLQEKTTGCRFAISMVEFFRNKSAPLIILEDRTASGWSVTGVNYKWGLMMEHLLKQPLPHGVSLVDFKGGARRVASLREIGSLHGLRGARKLAFPFDAADVLTVWSACLTVIVEETVLELHGATFHSWSIPTFYAAVSSARALQELYLHPSCMWPSDYLTDRDRLYTLLLGTRCRQSPLFGMSPRLLVKIARYLQMHVPKFSIP